MRVAPLTVAVVGELSDAARALPVAEVVSVANSPAAWQAALESASTPWFLVLPESAELSPDALASFAVVLRRSSAAAVYADESRPVAGAGPQPREILKPGFSPRFLLEGNYLGAAIAWRRERALDAGGFCATDVATDGYDLGLRLVDAGATFDHVAVILLRESARSWPRTSADAVEASLGRKGLQGVVEAGEVWDRVRFQAAQPKVSIVIPTRDRLDLLRTCIASLERYTDYPSVEIIVVDNDSKEPGTLHYLDEMRHAVVRHPAPFNFSDLVNAGVAAASGELLLLLNNDTYFDDPGWLATLVSELADPTVAAVGCRLIGVDGVPQHEGMGLGLGRHLAINLNLQSYCRIDGAARDIVAATAACVLIRRSAWDEIGGFDPALAVGYGDVDFCLRLRDAGYRVVYTPHSTVTHLGQASRGDDPHRYDDLLFGSRWPLHRSRDLDPFVNRRIEGFDPLWITPEFAMPPV